MMKGGCHGRPSSSFELLMNAVSLAIFVLLCAPVRDSIDSIAARATIWIRAGDRAVGAGWVVDVERRWIVTARHVVADRQTVEVFFQDRRGGRAITNRDHYLSNRADLKKDGLLATGKLLAKSDMDDLALLAVDRLPKTVPALALAAQPARAGEACFSIGHRHDAELLWGRTTGVIRQRGRLADGYFWAGQRIGVHVSMLFVQSPIEAGESGSALLGPSGKVVGVVSAVSDRTPGLAFAIDAAEVRKLLDTAGRRQPIVAAGMKAKSRRDVTALMHASVWVRPRATAGRAAGVLIDKSRGLVLTSAAGAGNDDIVDVVAPKWNDDQLVSEASVYRDLLGLQLSGQCVQGVVLARDLDRDLALVELDKVPEKLTAVHLASELSIGECVSAVAHPVGEELLWLYAAGTVRAVGKVVLRRPGGYDSVPVLASLLQLPIQGSSSGGPVVNARGELAGVLANREGA